MKLTALGIDSKDLDRKRLMDLEQNLKIVRTWIHDPDVITNRKSVCKAASLLDKLVSRPSPLTQYRGLEFKDPVAADNILSGKMVSKYECESWTPKESIAESFAPMNKLFKGISYLMKRKFSKNEVILDVDGLTQSLRIFAKEFKAAMKKDEWHPTLDLAGEKIFSRIVEYMLDLYESDEEEFLMHPRPYTPKDIVRMKIDEGYKVDKRTPILLKVLNSHEWYLPDELIGKWLFMKAGQIEKVE